MPLLTSAVEGNEPQRLDYGQAVLELKAAAEADPEIAQAVVDVEAAVNIVTENLSVRPQHKLFRSERLSVVTENLSVHSEHNLFRSERLSVRSEHNLFRSERLSVRSEHNLFRSERLCFHHHNLSKAYQSTCFVQNACLSIAKLMRSLTTLKQSLSIKLFRYQSLSICGKGLCDR